MKPNGPVQEARLRVRYAETDQMGIAYHANHIVWMEVGRVEYCRAIGIRYKDMEERDGILLAVVEVHCRYHAPARYDDELTVATRVNYIGSRAMQFDYELRLAPSGQLVAEGYSKHVFCDAELRPMRLPQKYRDAFLRSEAVPAL